MGMNNLAHRIAHRYLHADALINLSSIPVVLADGGVVSSGDLERLLGVHGIDAHDVVLYRLDGDPPNVFRWAGRGSNDTTVRGQIVVNLAHDHRHVVVQAEIALATRYKEASQAEDPTTEPMLPVKQRLQLIRSIARRAIQDLRSNPEDLGPVLMHLSDIAEISEQAGWAVEP